MLTQCHRFWRDMITAETPLLRLAPERVPVLGGCTQWYYWRFKRMIMDPYNASTLAPPRYQPSADWRYLVSTAGASLSPAINRRRYRTSRPPKSLINSIETSFTAWLARQRNGGRVKASASDNCRATLAPLLPPDLPKHHPPRCFTLNKWQFHGLFRLSSRAGEDTQAT